MATPALHITPEEKSILVLGSDVSILPPLMGAAAAAGATLEQHPWDAVGSSSIFLGAMGACYRGGLYLLSGQLAIDVANHRPPLLESMRCRTPARTEQ